MTMRLQLSLQEPCLALLRNQLSAGTNLILPLSGQPQAGVQHDTRRVLQGDKDVGSGSQTRV